MDQKTPLYQEHVRLGGTMVPFGGFLLPVQYPDGILAEHNAVRQAVGIFDVSHMGEAVLEGPDALANLNHLLTNRFDSLKIGGCRYAVMLYEDGGAVDDLIVYRLDQQRYLLILNAANTAKDVAWIREHLQGEVQFEDISARVAQIAVQGPESRALLARIADQRQFPEQYYHFALPVAVAGADCLMSRTGYTGEHGYELYMRPEDAVPVWQALLNAGAVPCGLGARDTLRLEAGMPLYGHELSETIDPITAGLTFAVKLDKDFIGRQALLDKGEPPVKRVGLKVTGRGILREHQPVFVGDRQIGETTSGTYCPWLKVSCAMAYLDKGFCEEGTAVETEARGRRIPCVVTALPFYNRAKE